MPEWRDLFLEACDDNGRPVFQAIFNLADRLELALVQGTRGFSVKAGPSAIPLSWGYPPKTHYNQRGGQSLSVELGRIRERMNGAVDWLNSANEELLLTGLFAESGGKVVWEIEQPVSSERTGAVIAILENLAKQIQQSEQGTGTTRIRTFKSTARIRRELRAIGKIIWLLRSLEPRGDDEGFVKASLFEKAKDYRRLLEGSLDH